MDQKIRTILIDDEKSSREVLKIKLGQICPCIEIIGEAESNKSALEICENLIPDLIFLDVKLIDGSSFDFLEKCDKIDFEVILATGYNDYAYEAIKADAVDYIVKPFKNSEIIAAVNKAKERIQYKNFHKKYHNIASSLFESNENLSIANKLIIHTSTGQIFLDYSQIIRCEGWDKYTYFYLTDGVKLLSAYNIGKYVDKLERMGFIHCHKSHLINKAKIKEFVDGFVTMEDNSKVPVARRRRGDFQANINAK